MRRLLLAVGASIALIAASLIADAPSGERWCVTHQAGIHHRRTNRVFDNPYAKIMAGYTALGASVAVADLDRDDFFLTDLSETGKNRLYRNKGNFTFTDVAEEAGVANGNGRNNASAAALWLDFNNDGWLDVLVVRFGHNQLFQNLGNRHFKDVTRQAGLDRYLHSIAAIAFDYHHDGYVDLMIGAYLQPVNLFQLEKPRSFSENFETTDNGGGVALCHNNGNGTFTDVTEKAGLKLRGWTLGLGHGDADNEGWGDLYIAGDRGTDRFFHNQRDGTIKDITESAIGFDTKKGMNVYWGDFDNDGLIDISVTDITDDYMREANFLWRNNGDLTLSEGCETARSTPAGAGAKLLDYDNDGWQDAYAAAGWVRIEPDTEDQTGVSELRGSATRMFTNHMGLSTPAISAKSRGAAVYRCMAG